MESNAYHNDFSFHLDWWWEEGSIGPLWTFFVTDTDILFTFISAVDTYTYNWLGITQKQNKFSSIIASLFFLFILELFNLSF